MGSPDRMPVAMKSPDPKEAALTALEIESIEMFIGFFKLIGLQKSVGEIYGLLFVSEQALPMDVIMERLDISLGAASQGLKVLRSVGAIKAVYAPGDRRDHFVADLELSKFATAFIKEKLQPRLDRALQSIDHMQYMAGDQSIDQKESAHQRIERLRHWIERAEKMMPWILRFLVK
jgi:DNA-binding transcriptional regulator GbsR (MarR family)